MAPTTHIVSRAGRLVLACALVAGLSPMLPAQAARHGAGAAATANRAASPSLLPQSFDGWQRTADTRSTDPNVADPTNGPVLKEYGMTVYEAATYTRDGEHLKVRVLRFPDASGAYGVFTFYKRPEMRTEEIGDQAGFDGNHVLFYAGGEVVDAVFDRLSAMSAAELRDLAKDLPRLSGSAANLPTIPRYLPKQSYVHNSAKYAMGPVAWEHVSPPFPASLVDFDGSSAEAVLGQYTTDEGTATLALLSYPTPQIAADRAKAIEAWLHGQPQRPGQMVRRTGPIVAVTAGSLSDAEARSLLGSIHYQADVTWSQPIPIQENQGKQLFSLLVGLITLVSVLVGAALVLGLVFGGGRVLLARLSPERYAAKEEERELIQLKLR